MQSYVESVRQNIAGQGRVLELGHGGQSAVQSGGTPHSLSSSGYNSNDGLNSSGNSGIITF